MSFTPSLPPDITETLPAFLSARGTSQALSTGGTKFDVSIGGIGFILDASGKTPYKRASAPFQKQQIDTSTEAGEQSLDGFWTRSQTSWHRGGGSRFYEPGYASSGARFWEQGAEVISEYRYDKSVGVDVWTRDKATLLRKTSQTVSSSGSAFVSGAKMSDGTDIILSNVGGTVKRINTAGTITTYTMATAALTRVAVAGSKLLIGHGSGIDIADMTGTSFAASYTITAGATVTPFWVKQRIIAARGNVLYELPLNTSASTGILTSNIIMTHPDPNWNWVGVCDTPAAILVAGASGGKSEVYKFTLRDNGSGVLPSLSQPFQIAQMPTGEEIHSIHGYLGTWLAIGTNRGIRIAQVDVQSGNIMYGPLVVETSNPVESLTSRSSFIYGGVKGEIDGGSGAVCINLGEPLPHEEMRFAWSWDVQTHNAGSVDSICFYGTSNQMALGVTNTGVYTQSATLYEPTGYLLSGRIRYRTVENKLFRLVDLRTEITDGSVSLGVVDETGNETNVVTLTKSFNDGSSLKLSYPSGYHQYLQFKTYLNASASGTISPTLDSLRVKALPAPRRQRLIQFPLQCSDKERDSMGVPFGKEGFALTRLQALEAAEQNSVVLQVTDYTTNEAYDCSIESIEFTRTTPRAQDGKSNFGGGVVVTVRVV